MTQKTQRQQPLVFFFFAHTRRRLHGGGNDLSLTLSLSLTRSLSCSVQEVTTVIQQHSIQNECPKSYLYLYDFSAYLHFCLPIGRYRSGPVHRRAGFLHLPSGSIRRDIFQTKNVCTKYTENRNNVMTRDVTWKTHRVGKTTTVHGL